MPVVSPADLITLRTTRHATRFNLCVYVPPTIWKAQVSGNHAIGATSIAINVGTIVNTRTPAKNFWVWFGTTDGAKDLGEGRFKSYAAGTLVIGENNATLTNNSWVTVKEEIKPQAIHWNVDASDVIFEDNDIAYGSSANVQYDPTARTGTHACAYLDETTGLATVSFYGARSSPNAPGATYASCTWYWRNGTVVSGSVNTLGTAGAPNVVTWNTVGDYYCSLTYVDSNGKSHTRYFVVFIRNEHGTTGVPLRQLEISNLEGDVEAGICTASLKVWSSATETEFPNQALCVIFADDFYDDTRKAIGWELYRENIVMVGYIKSDSMQRDYQSKGYVEFEIESASGVVASLLGLAGELETTAGTPAAWHVLQNMTYNLAAHHVLNQHTTLTQIADCYFNLNAYYIEFVDLPEGSIIDQLIPMCGTTRGRLGSNAQGHFYLEPYPQLIPVASRSVAYILDTTLADFSGDLDLGQEQHQRPDAQIQFWGEDSAANPFASNAPPFRWMDGLTVEMIDNIRVADQNDANTFAGLFEGQRNNPFSEVVVNWRGNYRIFNTFPAEPLSLNVGATQNNRGLVWSHQRMWLKRFTYEYRAGILTVNTVLEKDTGGPPGMGVPMEGDDGTYPVVIPTPPTIPSLPPYSPPPMPSGVIPNDVWDGIAVNTGASTTRTLFVGLPQRRYRIKSVGCYCTVKGTTFKVYVNEYANASIVVDRISGGGDDGKWRVRIYNGSTGALISTWMSSVSATSVGQHLLTGADIVTGNSGYLFKTEIVTVGAVSLLAYGLGAETY